MPDDLTPIMRMIDASQEAVLDKVQQMIRGSALRPATVFGGYAGEQQANRDIPIILDGDAEAALPGETENIVTMINLTGSALSANQRVMVQFVPPHAGFVVAKMPPMRTPALKLAYGATVSDAGPGVALPLGDVAPLEGEEGDFIMDFVTHTIQPINLGRYVVSASVAVASSAATRQTFDCVFDKASDTYPVLTGHARSGIEPGETVEVSLLTSLLTFRAGDTMRMMFYGDPDLDASMWQLNLWWQADGPVETGGA
jgi:hypothetical protein